MLEIAPSGFGNISLKVNITGGLSAKDELSGYGGPIRSARVAAAPDAPERSLRINIAHQLPDDLVSKVRHRVPDFIGPTIERRVSSGAMRFGRLTNHSDADVSADKVFAQSEASVLFPTSFSITEQSMSTQSHTPPLPEFQMPPLSITGG